MQQKGHERQFHLAIRKETIHLLKGRGKMKLTEHPEYRKTYLNHQDAFHSCKLAVASFRASNQSILVPHYQLWWTYETAQAFVQSLSQLFQEYNHVLWQKFHYCRQCGGQCCVVDASGVRPFDFIAVALLDQSIPSLPERITAGERNCIYLMNQRCSWPTSWRTIKCWAFYCLGAGPWRSGAKMSDLRGEICAQLQQVVRNLLPDQLRQYEAAHAVSLADFLDEPISFSDALYQALDEIFVSPFNQIYPFMKQEDLIKEEHAEETQRDLVPASQWLLDEVSVGMTKVVEQIYDSSSAHPVELEVSLEQVLEDLESLRWIIEGHPSHGKRLLEEMKLRYVNATAPAAGEDSTICDQMHDLIRASIACFS